jgi:hypothetical protein
MAQGTKMFTVDRFLGLNEAADGNTELKMGQASRMVNWVVTDGYNIATRPGVQRLDFEKEREPAPILAMWAGFIGDREYLVLVDFYGGKDRVWMYQTENGGYSAGYTQEGALGLTAAEGATVKIFPFGGKVWIMSDKKTVAWENGTFTEKLPYVPLVVIGADPAGGGTTLENINLLSPDRRITYSPDGTEKDFWLPEEATGVKKVVVDNEVKTNAGSFSASDHKFTFTTAPVKGVGNVEITYTTDAAAAEAERLKIVRMPLAENYNGSTDTRLFVAGDGTNICYYTGLPESGEVTALYFPAMNEVAVDMSDSPITAISRHYSKLLVFKPDGTYTITYEPVTLTDGKTIAGFFLRAANREFGCDVLGQVQTVDNYPRTLTKGGIYEWKITSSYYQDERYAKRVSDKVERTLRKADITKAVTCDDTADKTYYVFLNDNEGTVLVSRYALDREDIWCVYKGARFRGVKKAVTFGGRLVFAGEEELFYLDEGLAADAADTRDGAAVPVEAEWESGFMAFGADYLKKYSSQIYVNLLPQSNSEVTVTAETDRRTEYVEKTVAANVFGWPNMNFPNWTFDVNDTPKTRRVRLKVKKFVYYKLIFKAGNNGSKATVLGYDQQVRFGSMAK